MSAQHVLRAPRDAEERRFGNRALAAVLGVVALLLLLFALSAPLWLEADLERLGLGAFLSQAGGFTFFITYVWLFAVPLAVVFGATAAGVAARSGTGRVFVFVVVAVAALLIPNIVGGLIGQVIGPVFGVGGALIELFLVLTFYFWARERAAAPRPIRMALDLRMAGYGFFAVAAWFVCGMLAMPVFGLDAATQMAIGSPGLAIGMAYALIAYFVFGWALLFASQYLSASTK